MKIRFGFVSNSSSTSFCIYGAEFTISDFKKLLGVEVKEGTCDCDTECDDCEDCQCDADDTESFLQEKLGKTGLDYYYDYESEIVFIGKDLISIKDNQTGKQFKAETKAKLEKIVGKKVKCDMILDTVGG